MRQVRARWHRPAAFCIAIALAAAAHLLYGRLKQWGVQTPPSTAILAILLGLAIGNLVSTPTWLGAGCKVIIKKWIPYAIIGIGAGLDLMALAQPSVGLAGLAITVSCMAIAFGSAVLAGRLLGLGSNAAILLGAGTAVCGNAAVVAVAPVIGADDDDIVLSVSAVNLFGLLVTLVVPPIALALNMSDYAGGVWAGTSVHAVPQAIAAGAAISDAAGEFAALFKLVRVTMLAPLVMLVSLAVATRKQAHSRDGSRAKAGLLRLIPWFVWGFLIAAILNSLGWLSYEVPRIPGLIPEDAGEVVSVSLTLKTIGKWILTVAMAAIGLEIRLRSLVTVGGRVIVVGFIASLALLAGSYALILMWLAPVGSQ
ncbi:MAG: putative sulfate exporter family transporter [Planctomycetes bacterium]|nr:putative sulfate exporter family transporter [Planctomycetota bacterium]